MPVYLETIKQLTEVSQDCSDLEKLYGEYLSKEGENTDTLAWLTSAINSSTLTLYGGRFNGRLLGAVFIETDNQNSSQWTIKHLCVRKLTQRRGFARQLLQRLQQIIQEQEQAQGEQNITLVAESAESLEGLWTQLGFIQQENRWQWSIQEAKADINSETE